MGSALLVKLGTKGDDMKKIFIVLRSVLAVCLCMMLPSVALAADWNVNTSQDVTDAYYNDTDATVNIFMMDDIVMSNYLGGSPEKTFTINGNGYTISNLVLVSGGTTVINADVSSSNRTYAVEVLDETNVTINDDIEGSVYASGESTLTINGNVTGIDPGNDVDMDDPEDYSDPNASAVVAGAGDATITINGDVTGANGYGAYGYGQDGLNAYGNTNITVNGNVTAGNVIGKETVGQEYYESMGGEGIYQDSYSATITVNGDVTGGDTNTKLGLAGAGIVLDKGFGYYLTRVSFTPDEAGAVTVTGVVKGGVATGEDGVSGAAVAFCGSGEDFLYDSLEPSDISTDDLAQLTVLKLEPSEEGAALFGSYFYSDYEFTPEEIQTMADKTIYIVAPATNNGTVASNIDTALAGDTVTLTPTANEGFVLKSLLVNGVELFSENGVFSFT
ncbi:MAG: hypothetical protein NWF07_11750, partial [Candidatus Bathyarchaeota archaeon]|nr:hypothetical protein [Candidatus Bathyarchaeota archaeon]